VPAQLISPTCRFDARAPFLPNAECAATGARLFPSFEQLAGYFLPDLTRFEIE